MSWAAHSLPQGDSEHPSNVEVLDPYCPARQLYRMKPDLRGPRAPDGMLTKICTQGAWFCPGCIRYVFVEQHCPKCFGPMKWTPPIF